MQKTNQPKPFKLRQTKELNGYILTDDYAWMNQRDSVEVEEHLAAESKWYEYSTKATEELRRKLVDEMAERMKEEDTGVPYHWDKFSYFVKTVKDEQYLEHYRKRLRSDENPQLILDCNALAREFDYFDMGVFTISPDQQLLAYAIDTVGDESYNLYIKNIDRNELIEDRLYDICSAEWSADNETLFYTVRNEALRAHKVMMHRLGTSQSEDREVYVENDERFTVDIERSKNDEYMMICCESQTTSEYLIAPSCGEEFEFTVFSPRQQGVEYHVIPHVGRFYVLTNADGAYNFKLLQILNGDTERLFVSEIIPHNPEVKLENVEELYAYLILTMREKGLCRVDIYHVHRNIYTAVKPEEATYSIETIDGMNFIDNTFNYTCTSLLMPETTFQYNMRKQISTVIKPGELAVPYDPDRYVAERLYAKAADGTEIPVSIVYRKDFVRDGKSPLILYGYGAYGIPIEAGFSANRISLLERGFAFAIAHVRGGGDLGEKWYEAGKLKNKLNTFTDFIACAEMLIDTRFTSPKRLGIIGASAGGLLVGAVLNMRPDLFGAAVAEVPFVDLMNTMIDPALPLTIGEYEEWGNPVANADECESMLAYSPYDNIRQAAYPPILAIASIHDPRVNYWEAAKWIAKLREYNTANTPILLKLNTDGGHAGVSGRYDQLYEIADEYAFFIQELKIKN
ncbi:MAG: S9 family peptidase [Prevotellaceae bacterium]|jgi:oligopeptidase B|nr:S9 family peptidase [Prevotellaceae bacterium]